MNISISKKALFISIPLLINLFVCIYLCYLSGRITQTHLMALSIFNFVQTLLILIYCFHSKRLKEYFSLFSFNVVYFVFLQGSYLTNFGNESFYGNYIFTRKVSISYINEAKGLVYILLAQTIVFLSYTLCKQRLDSSPSYAIRDYSSIKKWCLVFMLLGGMAAFLKVGLKIIYVMQNGYTATYLANGSAAYQNAFLDLFDRFYYLGFYGYLATFPDIKQIKAPIALFFLYSFFTLLTGARGELVINLLFIIWYLSKRDMLIINEKEVLSQRRVLLLIIPFLLLLVLLYDYGFKRVGQEVYSDGLLNKFIGFLNDRGGSGRLVALGLEYRTDLLLYISPFMIVFSPIRDFFINNSLVRIFTGGMLGQSLQNLENAGSFANVLTYLTNPSSFINGASIGTSFVAELSVSFGFLGIIVFCTLLGLFLFRMDHIVFHNWGVSVFWMNAFVQLIYIARHATLQIIPESFNAVLFIILISLLSGSKSKTWY